ncbi:hypothetical protein [Flavobacterium sp.]|uniref:hypothetical protein n=1 Tax=Flavobacterium sp. TaxID=239 RepID=UPI003750D2B2
MEFEKVIRNNPLFEVYVENDFLIVNNVNYIKDNCVIKINDIIVVEVIRSLSLFDKIIEIMFGFWQNSKSDTLRINLKNGFKDVILTNCDIKKTELIVYKINKLINKKINKT